MLPLKDLNRTFTTPHVSRLLLITNIVVFAIYQLASLNILVSNQFVDVFDRYFVMVPEQVLHGQMLYTLLTSMFMHASWIHLLGNMLFLWIFGDNVEDAFGHVSYLGFYLLCGLLADFAFIVTNMFFGDLLIGVVGASGAIAGVLGAYLVMYPKAQILSIVLYVILPIPAIIFLGIWFILQWVYGFFDITSGVAYWAHVGGFIMGMVLGLTVGRKRKKAQRAKHRL